MAAFVVGLYNWIVGERPVGRPSQLPPPGVVHAMSECRGNLPVEVASLFFSVTGDLSDLSGLARYYATQLPVWAKNPWVATILEGAPPGLDPTSQVVFIARTLAFHEARAIGRRSVPPAEWNRVSEESFGRALLLQWPKIRAQLVVAAGQAAWNLAAQAGFLSRLPDLNASSREIATWFRANRGSLVLQVLREIGLEGEPFPMELRFFSRVTWVRTERSIPNRAPCPWAVSAWNLPPECEGVGAQDIWGEFSLRESPVRVARIWATGGPTLWSGITVPRDWPQPANFSLRTLASVLQKGGLAALGRLCCEEPALVGAPCLGVIASWALASPLCITLSFSSPFNNGRTKTLLRVLAQLGIAWRIVLRPCSPLEALGYTTLGLASMGLVRGRNQPHLFFLSMTPFLCGVGRLAARNWRPLVAIGAGAYFVRRRTEAHLQRKALRSPPE